MTTLEKIKLEITSHFLWDGEVKTDIPYTVQVCLDIIDKYAEQEPCDDVVSRQAVLNTLYQMDKALDEDRTVENYKALLIECYKALTPVRPQEPKWILTSEKLPNKSQWVLVTAESYQKPVEIMCYQGVRIGQHNVGNGWEEYEYPSWTSGHGDVQGHHPKAWMPLPKPFDPQESEDKE